MINNTANFLTALIKNNLRTMTFSTVTKDIRVSVQPVYLDDQSEPESAHYVWAYNVTIENKSDRPVQLINRYWHITDALGRIHEVRGPGVVGEQPVLKPGESYNYTSGTSLKTASGIMLGNYEMQNPEKGDKFLIDIPAFSLDSPHEMSRAN